MLLINTIHYLIVYLNLHGCNIRQIDNLNECVNLKHLILSFNEIHKIEGLEDLVLLERLELGFNLIKRIEGLRGLEALKKVELNNNLIYRLEDIGVLRKYLPLLSSLDLRNNAVCDVKGYRANVLRRIPSLNWFDGKVINDDDRKKCSRSSSTITEEDILQSGKNYGWPEITYGKNYSGTTITKFTHKEGMEQPILHWTPSIAVCGIDFYNKKLFKSWENNLLVTSLKFEKLYRYEINNNKIINQEMIYNSGSRIRDVETGPDGYIYLALEDPGRIVRLVPMKN